MSATKEVILIASPLMDSNRKAGRQESTLVRMSKKARTALGFIEKSVELKGNKTGDPVILEVFHAFKQDLTDARAAGHSEKDLERIGFVTTNVFNEIVGKGKSRKNIWISESREKSIIGADPEFLLFNNEGSVIAANSVLNKFGELGCDGAMAEVRPAPAKTVSGLITNIRKILTDKSLTRNIADLDWLRWQKNQQRL